jgi:hypothetical protein
VVASLADVPERKSARCWGNEGIENVTNTSGEKDFDLIGIWHELKWNRACHPLVICRG